MKIWRGSDGLVSWILNLKQDLSASFSMVQSSILGVPVVPRTSSFEIAKIAKFRKKHEFCELFPFRILHYERFQIPS